MTTLSEALGRAEWKVAIKTGLSGGIALFLGGVLSQLQGSDVVISGLWSAFSAIVVQQAHLGSTYRSSWTRVLGVLLGCLMGGFFTIGLGSNPASLSLSVFLTIVFCSLFNLKDSIRIACLSVAAVMVMWGLKPATSPWLFAFYRTIDSLLGVAVALLTAHLLWPSKVSSKIALNVFETFEGFQRLYSQACLLRPLSCEEQTLFTENYFVSLDQLWSYRQIIEDSQLELLTKFTNLDDWKSMHIQLEAILDKIASLRRIYKENLEPMVDEGLKARYQRLQEQTENAFQMLGQAIKKQDVVPSFDRLRDASEGLNEGLMHIRQMRALRSFELKEVEGFFVFFYMLRQLASDLIKMRGILVNLLASE